MMSLLTRTFALVMLLAAGGCSSSETGSLTALALDTSDEDTIVDVEVGQPVELTLQTIGPGEYGAPNVSSTTIVFDRMDRPKQQDPAGATQVYHFHCVNTGAATITIPHVPSGSPFSIILQAL